MKKILFFSWLLFSGALWAYRPETYQILANDFNELENSWKGGFYTDDSKFYLKLKSDGFIQRVRFEHQFCSAVDSVKLVFKNTARVRNQRIVTRPVSFQNSWPALYGVNLRDYCWFEVEVSGINLNAPFDNQYALKIQYNKRDYYYGEYKDSLIPGRRIVDSSSLISWISLGPNGASVTSDGGVFYKIWEPIVDEVYLVVNDKKTMIKMNPDSSTGNKERSFVLYLSNSQAGDKYYYQFKKMGKWVTQIVSNEMLEDSVKIDPMARALTYDKKGGALNGYKNPWAVVQSETRFSFKNDNVINALSETERSNRIIYQLWPLTFNPKKISGKYVAGTFNDVAEKIDYLSNLGINAVEFLPVSEGRFDAGWGYALDSVLLVNATYGTPDDLMSLTDTLHSRGIQVILDIVINHVNNSLIRDPIDRDHDQSKYYDGNTDWGPRPRYSDINVQRWLLDSIVALVQEYHIDGLRFDMTKYIYNLGGSPAGYKFLQELNWILKRVQPNINLSAEELPNNLWMSKNQKEAGAGFDSQWNDKFKNAFEEDFSHFRSYNPQLNLAPLAGAIYGYSNQTNYGSELNFGNPLTTVNYLGSHDFVGNKNPILRLVSDYSIYERADNNYFLKVRPSEDQDWNRYQLIHNEFNHSVGKTAYGILFTKPGNLLFYQGEELANDIKITNEWSYINARENNSIPTQDVDINRYVGTHRMQWENIDPYNSPELAFVPAPDKKLFTGYSKFFKDMIRFRKAHPGFNLQNAYEVQLSANKQILSYQIDDGIKQYFIVANFIQDRSGEWVSFPKGSGYWWTEIINSSSEQYSVLQTGYRNVIAQQGGRSNQLRLKANTLYVFERSSKGTITEPLYFRSSLNNWVATNDYKLEQSSEHGDVYSVLINVDRDGDYDFKVANSDWTVEMGNPARGANVDIFGNDIFGQMSNSANMPNIRVKLKQGQYRFLFSISDYKFNFVYQ